DRTGGFPGVGAPQQGGARAGGRCRGQRFSRTELLDRSGPRVGPERPGRGGLHVRLQSLPDFAARLRLPGCGSRPVLDRLSGRDAHRSPACNASALWTEPACRRWRLPAVATPRTDAGRSSRRRAAQRTGDAVHPSLGAGSRPPAAGRTMADGDPALQPARADGEPAERSARPVHVPSDLVYDRADDTSLSRGLPGPAPEGAKPEGSRPPSFPDVNCAIVQPATSPVSAASSWTGG